MVDKIKLNRVDFPSKLHVTDLNEKDTIPNPSGSSQLGSFGYDLEENFR